MKLKPYPQIFNHTRNSYKFYWWLAILELVIEEKKVQIKFEEIVLRIIVKMWYPVNYFHLSFGIQDQCTHYITQIKNEFKLPEDISPEKLLSFLIHHKDSPLIVNINSQLTRFVPYRFIRPWYAAETRGLADQKVNSRLLELQDSDAPYIIDPDLQTIQLEEETKEWIIRNYKILEAHTLFELLKYLEINNPNVPNIRQKLVRPEKRNLSRPTRLWRDFIHYHPTKPDVFERKMLGDISSLSIDHFLPWSFVAHDLVWNLHPVEKLVNIRKSNFLPSTHYLEDFFSLQYSFSRFLISKQKTKDLENFYILFKCSKEDFQQLNKQKFQQLLQKVYGPQMEIASTMGFATDWVLN